MATKKSAKKASATGAGGTAPGLDPARSDLSKQVALGRWGKPFSASIKAKLDEPKEWVEEAAHLNDMMPRLLETRDLPFRWINVLPVEFSNPKVTTVGVYALFVYVHLKTEAELAAAIAAFSADATALQKQTVTSKEAKDAVKQYLKSAAGV